VAEKAKSQRKPGEILCENGEREMILMSVGNINEESIRNEIREA
jgi:hypothetical protein